MWSATDGATPVYRWTSAASAIFSKGVRGTPRWAKTLKRVPELPKAQEGSSMLWARNVADVSLCTVMIASIPFGGPFPPLARGYAAMTRCGGTSAPVAASSRRACHRFRLLSISFLTFRSVFL